MATAYQTKSPSASSSKPGGRQWLNVGSIFASDNYRARYNFYEAGVGDYIEASGFGFEIPEGVTINGVRVRLECRSTGARASAYEIKLCNDIEDFGTKSNSTLWPENDTIISIGGSSDTWDYAWTPGLINSSYFAVQVRATTTDATVAEIDHISLTIWYEVADAPTINATISFGVGVGISTNADLGYPNVDAASAAGVGVGFSMNAYLDIPATISFGVGVYSSHAENNRQAALKIYADKTCYHFKWQDVLAVVEAENTPSIIHEYEDGHITQYQTGIGRKMYNVKIRPTLENITAIKALQKERGIMRLHWDYMRNPSTFANVKIDPRAPINFYAGAIDAEAEQSIVFYETV